jgi:hypothetical protein
MRTPFLPACALALASLTGCGPSEPDKGTASTPPPATTSVEPIDPPPFDEQASLVLLADGKNIVLGELASNALIALPRPPGAFEFTDVPPGFKEGYAARGWEGNQGGFGVLTRDGRVVLAMRYWSNASNEMISDTKEAYSKEIGRRIKPIDFGDDKRGYRFWRDGLTQLMLCWSPDVRGRTALVAALGDARIMAALRMDPRNAAQDLARADQLMAQLSKPSETKSEKR